MTFFFSIITVCLNSEKTIKKSIESLVNQSCNDFEYIIIDGLSDDSTCEIIDKFKISIDKFISEKDNGIYDAMNKGLSFAKGEVVFFLNSDDYFFDDNVLQDLKDIFIKDPDLQIVYGNQIFHKKGRFLAKKVHAKIIKHKNLCNTTIQHQSLFARREIFNDYKFDITYKIVADYDWICQKFLVDKVKYLSIDRDISVMDTEGLSWTNSFEKERIVVMKKYFSYFDIFIYRFFPIFFKRLLAIIKK